jgi:hypothetical protein
MYTALYVGFAFLVAGLAAMPIGYLYIKSRQEDNPVILEKPIARGLAGFHVGLWVIACIMLFGTVCGSHDTKKGKDQLVYRESLIGRAFVSKAYDDQNVYEVTLLSSDATSQTVMRLTKSEMELFMKNAGEALK